MSKDKHMAGEIAEQYGDYILMLIGVIGVGTVVGALAQIVIFPDFGTSGLLDTGAQFWTLNSNTITNGAGLAGIVPLVMYGTNQLSDALMNVEDSWKETEFGAVIVAVALPVGYQVMGSTAASGSPGIQAVFVTVYVASVAYLADL